MDKFVEGGQILYDLGCRSHGVCQAILSQILGKREITHVRVDKRKALVTCTNCCNSTEICNVGGQCGTNPVHKPSFYKYCYECPHATTNPEDCQRIALCTQHQTCYTTQSINRNGELKWQHGCVPTQECSSMTTSGNYSCVTCCDGDFCNDQCTFTTSTTTAPSTTTPLSTSTPLSRTTPLSTTSLPSTTTVPSARPNNTHVEINPQQYNYGGNVRIVCKSTGHPTPFFVFVFKNSVLESNILELGNVLIVQNYQPKNDGDYLCVAKNSLGSDVVPFHLQGHHS